MSVQIAPNRMLLFMSPIHRHWPAWAFGLLSSWTSESSPDSRLYEVTVPPLQFQTGLLRRLQLRTSLDGLSS